MKGGHTEKLTGVEEQQEQLYLQTVRQHSQMRAEERCKLLKAGPDVEALLYWMPEEPCSAARGTLEVGKNAPLLSGDL